MPAYGRQGQSGFHGDEERGGEVVCQGRQRADGFYGDFGSKKAAKNYSCNRHQYLTTTMNIEYSKWING